MIRSLGLSAGKPIYGFWAWSAIQTVPYVPRSHPFIERLIGTLRREYLDRCLFWNVHDLKQKLATLRRYYNQSRVHQGLAGDTPEEMAGTDAPQQTSLHNYPWQSHCNRLFELPIAA